VDGKRRDVLDVRVEPLLCGSGGSIVDDSIVTMAKDLAVIVVTSRVVRVGLLASRTVVVTRCRGRQVLA